MEEEPTRGGRSSGEAPAAESSAAYKPSKLAAGLHVVATPIGNLGDIGERARATLAACDLVLCEDTRVTGKLLHHLGIERPMLAYHEHSAARLRPQILARLEAGERLVLVSDAGTPCLADPGFKLVREAQDAGVDVAAVPGPSSITAALSIAGLPTDRFFFQGFLPSKAGERRKVIDELAAIPGTLVILESPARIAATLADCAAILGPRPAAVARELTKLHEEVRRGTLAELAQRAAEAPPPRGEIVLLIAAGEARPVIADEAAIDAALLAALAEHKPSRAAAIVATQTGQPRDSLYRRALALRR